MATLNSFDVTSTIDLPEVDNAVNQARKEIGQRFDFKGSVAAIDLDQKANTLTLTAEDNFKLESVWDVLQTRLIKRGVPIKNMKREEVQPASGSTVKQVITLQQGIPSDAVERRIAGRDGGAAGERFRDRPPVWQLPLVRATFRSSGRSRSWGSPAARRPAR
jgi:uncharacterized protein YajQ (UPF0234 family)